MSDNEPLVVEEENEQVEVRKQKLAKLRDAGQIVYPNDFRPTHSVAAVIAAAGRSSDDEITLFKSVGAALEDLAAGIAVFEALRQA